MIVADANVVIAAITPGHVHHADAVDILREHGRDGIVLHSLTLAEILVGPARTGAEHEARAALEAAGIGLAPEGEPTPEALARVRATVSVTMPDACVLALAELLRTPMATFDRRLAREAGRRAVIVVGPDEDQGDDGQRQARR